MALFQSPWNIPLPTIITVNPHNSGFIADLLERPQFSGTGRGWLFTHWDLTTQSYGVPVYVLPASGGVPVAITGRTGISEANGTNYGSTPWWAGFSAAPLPADWRENTINFVAGGTDRSLCILDPNTGLEYDYWDFAWDSANSRYIAGSGCIWNSNGAGYQDSFDFGQGKPRSGQLAGRVAGTPYLSGLVRYNDMLGTILGPNPDAANLGHAIAFGYGATDTCGFLAGYFAAGIKNGVLHIASHGFRAASGRNRTDQTQNMPLGIRGRLKLTVDVEARIASYDAAKKTRIRILANTLKRYGIIGVENAGSGVLYSETLQGTGLNWLNDGTGRVVLNPTDLYCFPATDFEFLDTPALTVVA